MLVGLTNLPTELIDIIVRHIYNGECQCIQAISPLSLTCRALRSATKPLLFATLTIENNGFRLNTERAPRWVHDDANGSLLRVLPSIAEYIETIKFVSWERRSTASYNTDTWKDLDDLKITGCLLRLRTIIFDPPHTYTRSILRALGHPGLHVIFEYRNHITPGALVTHDPDPSLSYSWSLTTGNGHEGATAVARAACKRLRAIQWAYPTNQCAREDHAQLLEYLQSATFLEELQVSEKVLDLDERFSKSPSYAPQICNLMSRLPSLRRCRIEGNMLTKEFLEILPSLQSLQDLSIYSVYRRVFHKTCDLELEGSPRPLPTTDMSWLTLPNLTRLDLRFICKHFHLSQIIPSGLTHLRLEFYSAGEQITYEDLDWLVENCPDLCTLDCDLGPLSDLPASTGFCALDDPAHRLFLMFRKLSALRHLRTLRLLPTYWSAGKLLPFPFSSTNNVGSAVRLFHFLRTICPSLKTLIICISFGEYPFDAVPRMTLTSRPAKFVLKQVGAEDDVLVRWGYGASNEIYEVKWKGEIALSGFKLIPVDTKRFFDDLSEGWVLPHHELER